MQLNNRINSGLKFSLNAKWLASGIVLLVFSLLVAACGDNTATAVPPTVAATAVPAATGAQSTVAATTAAMSTSAATTAAATTAVVTTAVSTTDASTTAAMSTSAVTTSAATTSAATTAAVTTASVTTAAASGSTGLAKMTLAEQAPQAGTTVPITGEGFPPNTWVTLQFGPGTTTRSVASLALTDGSGKFNSQIIFSAYGDGSALVPGSNTLKGITQDGAVTATLTFTIVPAPATATPKA